MRNILFGFFCLACGAASAAAHAGVAIQHWTAPSGARVYYVASPALPMLDVEVDFSAGSAYDPAEKAGLAGLTVGLLDGGAQLDGSSLDEEQIAARVADIGARLTSSNDHDRASVRLRTLSSKPEREAAVELMRAVLATPGFPEAVLLREKARAIAAIEEEETQPESIAAKRFAQAIYPDHPYGINPSAPSVGRITREDLLSFWRGHYGAQGAVVAIIGDVSRAEAEAIANRLTEGLPESPAAPSGGAAATSLPAVTLPQSQVVRVSHPATQSHIFIGMPALRRTDPDFFPLLVGNYALGGGGFVSRLMQEVREKRGYAYSVYSYFTPRGQQGPFEIGLQTKRSQSGAAIELVDRVLAEFLKNGPTAQELKAAKQNLVDGQALRLDSNAKILGQLSLIGFYGLPLNYLDEFPRRIQAVTARQVKEAFARHIQPEHLVTVIVAGE